MEQVRTATADDLDRLVELVAEFADAQADRRGADLARGDDGGGRPPAPTADAVAPYLTDATRTALVGSLDGWVAGAALCRVGGRRRGPAWRPRPLLRGGRAHARSASGTCSSNGRIDWFRDRGCTGVDGTAYPGDRAAKSFFESAGFKARLLVMHRPLD